MGSKIKDKRKLNNKILIVCGGSTEKIYFENFNSDLGEIRLDAKLKNKNPTLIVNHAIELKNKETYRMVWCVFDKDTFSDFDQAITLAEANGIRCAYSNQAFDLWFILHYIRQDGSFNRTKYKGVIKDKIGRVYSKTDKKIYETVKPNIKTAITNAKIGHQLHKRRGGKPSEWESCTTVYELVETLLKWT